jgi:DNA-binding transcriptional ArsR family regulator
LSAAKRLAHSVPPKLQWLALPDRVRPVAEALHADHLATPTDLAARTGLSPRSVQAALGWLRDAGLLQGGRPLSDGRPGYVWLDLVPAARRAVEVAA